jgi:hypothetical protein
MTTKRVLYHPAGVDAVTIQRDVAYRATDAGALTMDLYHPAGAAIGGRSPAVVIVAGFPDPGVERSVGCKFKEMESCISWGRLMAASGCVAITYTNREPAADLHALLEHIRQNAASFGIDENRVGVWASSGNVPLALSALMQDAGKSLKCAVLCYGYMLDLDGGTGVAEAATQWRFVNASAGKSVDDLPQDLPLFIVRAGQDAMPGLNDALDRFLAHALTRNLPVTLTNHRTGPHAFDLSDDSETCREIIRQVLAFMRFHLSR